MDSTTAYALRPRAASIPLMGLSFTAFSERQTIDYVLDCVGRGVGGWICPANLEVLRQCRESAAVHELVSQADLVVADGMPLVWAGGLRGSPLPERVAGSTLVVSLSAAAASAEASIFLLGGNPGTADAAAASLTQLSPRLMNAGTLCPPVGFEKDPEWLNRIERSLLKASPNIVFVGLGFPKQERLIVRLRKVLPNAWFVSCGVSFSFVAGEIHRAPVLLQRAGLEWLHRMAQEPRRLFRRYVVQGIPFLVALFWWVLRARVSGARRSAPS